MRCGKKGRLEVAGMVSIFTYGFEVADEAFQKAGIPLHSLTNYPTLIALALEKGIIDPFSGEHFVKLEKGPFGMERHLNTFVSNLTDNEKTYIDCFADGWFFYHRRRPG
jgi:hypothetical protein